MPLHISISVFIKISFEKRNYSIDNKSVLHQNYLYRDKSTESLAEGLTFNCCYISLKRILLSCRRKLFFINIKIKSQQTIP